MPLIRSVPNRSFSKKASKADESKITKKLIHLVVSDMTALTNEQCNSLHCGDIVLKEDSTGQHAYIVSYKKEDTGMCITYTDASCVETVSYDLIEGTWTYNSTDKADLTKIPTV